MIAEASGQGRGYKIIASGTCGLKKKKLSKMLTLYFLLVRMLW
jgi:hypothetical protein